MVLEVPIHYFFATLASQLILRKVQGVDNPLSSWPKGKREESRMVTCYPPIFLDVPRDPRPPALKGSTIYVLPTSGTDYESSFFVHGSLGVI